MEVITIIAGFIAFLIFLLVLKKIKILKANIFLALFLLTFFIQLTAFYFSIKYSFYGILYVRTLVPLLYGPLIFLYVTFIVKNKKKLHLIDYLHFTPFIIYFAGLVYYLYFPYNENKVTSFQNLNLYHSGKYIIITSVILYITFSLSSLNKFKRKLLNKASFTNRVDLNWLNFLLKGFLITWFTIWILLTVNRTLHFIDFQNESYLIYTFIALFIFILSYFGIQQTSVFSKYEFLIYDEIPDNSQNKKDTLPRDQDEKLKEIFLKIDSLVNKEKLYLKHDLCINDISKKIYSNQNYTSKAINEIGGFNFFEYINKKRVDEFHEQINNPQNKNRTIISVAFDCGFGSKASFNRTYKKITGKNPSHFLNHNVSKSTYS